MIEKPLRNKNYLKWVRSLPCVCCSAHSVAHHLIGNGYSGMGTKVSDYWTIPLCNPHHQALHDHGWKEWEAIHGPQWRFVAETLDRAIREGVLNA